MKVNVFDVENFEKEVLNYEGTALVDFYADWCGPCKIMSPIISEIAEELEISRNGAYDAIKKSLSIMEDYETKLSLIKKEENIENYLKDNLIDEEVINGVIERMK